jgi:hypothetical protein
MGLVSAGEYALPMVGNGLSGEKTVRACRCQTHNGVQGPAAPAAGSIMGCRGPRPLYREEMI